MAFNLLNKQAFQHEVNRISNVFTPGSSQILDDHLGSTSRSGIRWYVLCLLRPFYALLGKDVYSHVRVHHVANQFFAFCEVNKDNFNQDAQLTAQMKERIVTPLAQKIAKHDKRRANEVIQEFARRFDAFLPPPPASVPRPVIPHVFRQQEVLKTSRTSAIDRDTWNALKAVMGQVCEIFETDPEATLSFSKTGEKGHRRRVLSVATQNQVHEFEVPLTLSIERDDEKVTDIKVISKTVIGKGDERKVRRICSLFFANQALVSKKLVSKEEGRLLRFYQKNPSRGIISIVGFRDVREGKRHVIESQAYCSMDKLFREEQLDLEDKRSLMEDLLHGLSSLHRSGFDQTVTLGEEFFKVPFYHGDLNAGNVLLYKENGHFQARITDFGNVGEILDKSATRQYFSPEYAQNMGYYGGMRDKAGAGTLTKQEALQVLGRLSRLGRAQDVWAMGVMFLNILQWAGGLSINAIDECSRQEGMLGPHPIGNISQKAIDDQLKALKNRCSPLYAEYIDRVIAPMLRVNPTERATAQEALMALKTVQGRDAKQVVALQTKLEFPKIPRVS